MTWELDGLMVGSSIRWLGVCVSVAYTPRLSATCNIMKAFKKTVLKALNTMRFSVQLTRTVTLGSGRSVEGRALILVSLDAHLRATGRQLNQLYPHDPGIHSYRTAGLQYP